MTRQPVLYIKSSAQWAEVLAPIRWEIVQGLRCIGPCSAAELGRLLDRPPDTLYRHLERLKIAGYVVECGARRKPRHRERLYDITAHDFAMDFVDFATPDGQEGVTRTARAFMTNVVSVIGRSAAAGRLIPPKPDPNFVLNYEFGWLTPEDFKKARAILYQLKVLMDDARTRRQGSLYTAVTVLCPETRTRRAESRTPRSKPTRKPHKPSARSGSA